MPKEEKSFSFPVRLSDEVERLFDEMIHRPWGFAGEPQPWNPSVDLYETPDAFILEADLPGVNSQDVQLELQDNVLILQGKRSFQRDYSGGTFFCQERSSGNFTRRISLPESVNKEQITAEFRDGVLRAVLPKIKERNNRP